MIQYLHVLYFLKLVLADCPTGEVIDFCKSPCQATCQTPIPQHCYYFACTAGCVCGKGLIRDEVSGDCVDPNLCPLDCSKDEVENILQVCESNCPIEHRVQQHLVEIKSCICKKGFFRHSLTNECVPLHECPNVCNANEILSNCTNRACRRTCQNRNQHVVCTNSQCEIGCDCRDDYIWDEYKEKCVPEFECSPECGENEEYRKCGDQLCRRTCNNIGISILCPKVCIPGCSCKSDYVYDENKKSCVHKDFCSQNCEENEEWSNCVNYCQGTCQYPGKRYCTLQCKSGCTCKNDFLWDKYKKKCVKRKYCSKVCDENQEWCDYIPGDLSTCQSLHSPMAEGWYNPTFVVLKPGCICKNGYILDEDSKECISFDDCLSGKYTGGTVKSDTSATLSTRFSDTTSHNQITGDSSISTSFTSKTESTATNAQLQTTTSLTGSGTPHTAKQLQTRSRYDLYSDILD